MKPAKVRETRTPIWARAIKSSVIRDEQGMALVITLLTLVALTFIGIASFFNASTDIKITGNLKGSGQALYAAEAGLVDMIDRLETDVTYKPPTPYTTAWAPVDLVASVNGFEYTVQVRHKVDTEDCDGDSVTNEPVLYSQSCYPMSPIAAGSANAYPVEVITATAKNDRYHNQTQVEITKQKFTVKNTGALTTRGPVDINGNMLVHGNTHDKNGNPAVTACGGTVPSITTIEGKPITIHKPEYTIPAADNTLTDGQNPKNPCEALGLPADCETSTLAPYAVPAVNALPMAGDIRWVQGDYAPPACFQGTGLLIVHTPGFDPDKCDPADAAYDATYCAAHPPARFGNVSGNCTFKGLILADRVDKLAGNGYIIGAIISFTGVEIDKLGAGTQKTLYSCEAINEFVGGKVNHKLSWERL